MIGNSRSGHYVLLDAGTVLRGIRIAQQQGALSAELTSVEFLNQHVKAIFLTHAHLDHNAGLVIASTDIKKMPVYGLSSTLSPLVKDIFNWRIWPNFTDRGRGLKLKALVLRVMQVARWVKVKGTEFKVMAFPLQHGQHYRSTAFLIQNGHQFILFFGDAGDDSINHSSYLQKIWHRAAKLIDRGELKAILIESSFTNSTPNKLLIGHLRPNLIVRNMQMLRALLRHPSRMKTVRLFIIHVKPSFSRQQNVSRRVVQSELQSISTWFLRVIFPRQGQAYSL